MSPRPAPPLPPRPALPPVLACGLGLWASCAAVYSAAQSWGAGACVAVGASTLAAAALAAVALLRDELRPGDVVLSKASKVAQLWRVAEALLDGGAQDGGTA